MTEKVLGTKGNIGDIIYPHYNGTASFFKKSRWDLVTKVDKNGRIIEVQTIQDYSTVRAIQLIEILNRLKKEAEK